MVHIHGDAGEILRKVPLAEIQGRFWALRSAFAGVDCATSTLVHGLRLEIGERPQNLTTEALQRMIRSRALAIGHPGVGRVEMRPDGTLLVDISTTWGQLVAQEMAHQVGQLAGEVTRVIFRSPSGEAVYEAHERGPEMRGTTQ